MLYRNFFAILIVLALPSTSMVKLNKLVTAKSVVYNLNNRTIRNFLKKCGY